MKKWLSVFFILATISLSAQEKIYAPTLTAPANGASNQIVNVLLDWNPVASAVKYQVHLDTSATFTNPQTVVVTYSAWQSALLLFGEVYSWRVRAIDAASDTSAWSAVRTFTVVTKPTLDKPSDSAKTVPVSPLLTWDAMSGVIGYQAQFDSVNTFDSPFLKNEFFTGSFEMRTNDNYYGDRYYWRVRAINNADTSEWSNIRTFVTRDSIALLSPSDGLTGVHPVDSIKFKSIYGTTGYQFAFDGDPGFSAPYYFNWDSTAIRIFSGDTTARGAMDTIPFGMQYWKVRLFNHVDTSKWSAVRSLTTIAKVTMLTPANAETDVVVTSDFTWEAIRGAKFYILEYDTAASFTSPIKVQVNVTTNSYDPPTNLLSQTNYYWRVRCATENDTTSTWDEYTFKTYFGVGIDEASNATWSVYPNPTNGVFYLTVDAASSARMEILNVLGDVVFSKNNLVNGTNLISIENLNNGMYMMRLILDGNTYTSRIIKK